MKGISIHFGLNKVSPITYQGWEGRLTSCEADAQLMESIAIKENYQSLGCFLTKKATKSNFKVTLDTAKSLLVAGDILLLTFSGHGGKKLDKDGDEVDGQDEFWFFYDGIITDDYIYNFLKSLAEGVRVLIISDSCFSGSMLRKKKGVSVSTQTLSRIETRASVQLIASSKETEYSWTGRTYSLFTQKIYDVLITEKIQGNYIEIFEEVKSRMPKKQTPVHLKAGELIQDFLKEKPFQIK